MDYTTMTEDEIYETIDAAKAELVRRQNETLIESQVAAVYAEARQNGVVQAPEVGGAWRQPQGAHDAYVAGDTVAHNGKTWVSTVTPNVWEPGVSGWREDAGTDEDGNETPAEWIQPTGAHDAYQTGDTVTFEGSVYQSLIDANTWSPTDYPQGWERVSDA